MKTRRRASPSLTTLMVLVLSLLLAVPAVAQQHGGGGGGDGGDGGEGGEGELYAELVVALRDEDGRPIVIGPFIGEHGEEWCVQPVTTERVPNPYHLLGEPGEDEFLPTEVNPADGRTVTKVPLFAFDDGAFLPPVDEDPHGSDVGTAAHGEPGPPDDHDDEGGEPCDPLVLDLGGGETFAYGQYVTEVELERLNLARTQPGVLERHLAETVLLINSADVVTLDEAGRFAFEGESYEGEPILDAGPKLQAVRQELLETGTLPDIPDLYPFPFQLVHPQFSGWDTFELSAFALGGAASKFGTINVDIVAYHDRVLNLGGDVTWDGWEPIEGPGGELFVNYRGFEYDREETFKGCVTYLDPANWSAGYKVESILDAVDFPPETPKQTNIAGYAQMAEDGRAVVLFIHDYEPVIHTADPVGVDTCAAQLAAVDDLNDPGEPPPPPPPPPVEDTFQTSLWTTYRTATGWQTHISGDVNGNGRDDVLSYHPSNGTWWITTKTDAGALSTSLLTRYRTLDGWTAHVAGDLNGNGRDDVLSFHPTNGTWWITEWTGTSFRTRLFTTYKTRLGWAGHVTGDMDGDGRDELLSYHPSNGTWWITEWTGTSFRTRLFTTYKTLTGWQSHVTGDIGGDGAEDLLSYHPSNGTWWVTESGLSPRLYTTYKTETGWGGHVSGDLTTYGDLNRAELLSYHPSNGTWWITEYTAAGVRTRLFHTYDVLTGWQSHLTGDVTGNGRDDLLSYYPPTGAWWLTTETVTTAAG
jgi:hypothetical protein